MCKKWDLKKGSINIMLALYCTLLSTAQPGWSQTETDVKIGSQVQNNMQKQVGSQPPAILCTRTISGFYMTQAFPLLTVSTVSQICLARHSLWTSYQSHSGSVLAPGFKLVHTRSFDPTYIQRSQNICSCRWLFAVLFHNESGTARHRDSCYPPHELFRINYNKCHHRKWNT